MWCVCSTTDWLCGCGVFVPPLTGCVDVCLFYHWLWLCGCGVFVLPLAVAVWMWCVCSTTDWLCGCGVFLLPLDMAVWMWCVCSTTSCGCVDVVCLFYH